MYSLAVINIKIVSQNQLLRAAIEWRDLETLRAQEAVVTINLLETTFVLSFEFCGQCFSQASFMKFPLKMFFVQCSCTQRCFL